MTIKKTFKYCLKLNKIQKQKLDQILKHCSWLYNHLLEQFRKRDKNKEKQLTKYQLINCLVQIKKAYPFLKEVHSTSLQEVAKRVHKTWQRYLELKKLDPKKKYPNFKPNHRYNSFTYAQSISKNGCGYEVNNLPITKRTENRELKLTLGRQNKKNTYLTIKIRMERNFEGDVKTLTIKREIGKYYTLFSCDNIQVKPLPKTNKSVGLDLGIRTLITTSDGNKVENPKFYKKSEQVIKETQQSLSSKVKGSQNWKDNKLQLVKQWKKMVNQSKYHSHQIANDLVKNYDDIAIEKLDIKSMFKKKSGDGKRTLRQNLQSVGLGILSKVISEKTSIVARRLVRVNPKNTTQTCSNCYELAKEKLTLKDRIFKCWNCEFELDRDINSARNILSLGFDRNPPLIKENNF